MNFFPIMFFWDNAWMAGNIVHLRKKDTQKWTTPKLLVVEVCLYPSTIYICLFQIQVKAKMSVNNTQIHIHVPEPLAVSESLITFPSIGNIYNISSTSFDLLTT